MDTYQKVLEHVLAGYWEWDFQKNSVFLSKRFKENLGYQEQELDDNQPETIQKLAVREDSDAFLQALEEHIQQGGKETFTKDMRYYHKKGHLIWVNCTGSVLEWDKEHQKPIKVFGCHIDITLLKQKEEEAEKVLKKISSQRNQLENFTQIVSHNLRSHSHNFTTLIEMFKEAKEEQEKEYLFDCLDKATIQFSQTVTDLNEVVDSKRELEHKKIYIKDFVTSLLNNLIVEIESKEVSLKLDIAEKIWIDCNPAYLDSILLNLITNAIKYKHPERSPCIAIKIMETFSHIVIEIQDNGIGINLEKYGEKLFGMYKTFHGNQDAKGIGLFITRNQIEQMSGMIEVESVVGEGTCFKILFPIKK